jgi:phage tail-like protein
MALLGVNALFAASGIRLDPYMGYNFFVEIDGLLIGGFREIRGMESHVEVKEYAEGGVNGYIHKIPGEVRHSNITLSRGLIDLDTMYGWYSDVAQGTIKRRNLTILLMDAERIPAMWWDVRGAIPVKWTGPTLNAASGSEVATESLELAHKGIVKPALSRVLSAARLAASQVKALSNAMHAGASAASSGVSQGRDAASSAVSSAASSAANAAPGAASSAASAVSGAASSAANALK